MGSRTARRRVPRPRRDAPQREARRDHLGMPSPAVLARFPPAQAGTPRQVAVGGTIGAFRVYGLIDFVLVRWEGDYAAADPGRVQGQSPRPHLPPRAGYRLPDAPPRAARRWRPLRSASSVPTRRDRVASSPASTRDGTTTQSILALPPLDLAHEEADLNRACSPPTGRWTRPRPARSPRSGSRSTRSATAARMPPTA